MEELIRYTILDPTGNITALVSTGIPVALQPRIAAELMRREPEVEQVGFIRFPSAADGKGDTVELRMAGGEFCGNASMCAAVLWYLHNAEIDIFEPSENFSALIKVSGAEKPVMTSLCRNQDSSFSVGVRMPPVRRIQAEKLSADGISGKLPVVYFEGISHIIISTESNFWKLLTDRSLAAIAVRQWCAKINADGLGLLFLQKREEAYYMDPLVYIPGSDTVFYENSCASGSAAVGMYLARNEEIFQRLELHEPGGILRVECDPASGETWLFGNVCIKNDAASFRCTI